MKIVKVLAMDPDLINASSLNSDSDSVRYGIDETIYRYGDRVRQANGFINMDEKSGIVRLAQPPYDSAGGVFESRITSTDLSDIASHVATTKLKK
ncbi:unnamed protein product [Onchocerca flexuosa]|uniref:DNA-directed RNA polymerase n=1 Tax=Onchocerca flexuosa TaxID=387005 RepID=A0A183I0J3_9BILA|nr:unnamed protein product [Onchocerca flexuosa]